MNQLPDDRFSEVYSQVLRYATLQFHFSDPVSRPIWDFQVGPHYTSIIGLTVLVLIGALALFQAFPAWLRERTATLPDETATASPRLAAQAMGGQTLLSHAESLAAAGHFTDAVHVVLGQSLIDIRARCPAALQPALTSRDIARLDALPDAVREAFGGIARLVEQGVFAGRPLGSQDYATCRDLYTRAIGV